MPVPSGPAPLRARRRCRRLAIASTLLLAGVASADLQEGDILVVDSTANKLYEIVAGTPVEIASGGALSTPIGIAADDQGQAFTTILGGTGGVLRIQPNPQPPLPVQAGIRSFFPDRPRGIALDPANDHAFVAVPGNALGVPDAIYRIDTVAGTGITLTAAANLLFPAGLVREASGALVVADSGVSNFQNISKVVRVDPRTGAQTLLARNGKFMVLRDIEVDPEGGGFLVVDSGARKVFRVDDSIPFDPDAPEANQFEWAACTQFISPRGIAVEPAHDTVPAAVLVADFSAKQVYRIPVSPPRVCTPITSGSTLQGPWDVAVVGEIAPPLVPGPLLVAGGSANQVYRVDPVAGTGGPVVPGLDFVAPVAAIRDLDGDLLVLEDDRIIRVVGNLKSPLAVFDEPVELTGFVVQVNGDLLVTDAATDRLWRVTPAGVKTVLADSEGTPTGPFQDPRGIALGIDGQAVIANAGDPSLSIPTWVARVNPFTGLITGSVTNTTSFGKLVGIAVDADGDYLLADESKDTVWRSAAGTQFNVSDGGDITSLRGIAVDQNRSILVTNQGAKEILRIDSPSRTQSEVAPALSFSDIRGISLDRIPSPPILDLDLDTVADPLDNCSDAANPDQTDTDQDGFGNRCDADFDNSGVVNALDLGRFKAAYLTQTGNPGYDAAIDLDSDGVIGALDLGIFRSVYLRPAGPSGLTCAGSPPCPLP